MTSRILVVTGTDTGVGKTVLVCLLARLLRARQVSVAACKPVASGGRSDARRIRAALDGAQTLDEINPFHFRAPLAPRVASRREHRRVHLADILLRIRRLSRRSHVSLIEGAGGLLSPLGDDFNTRDLIARLRAIPIIVAPNRLGAVNHVLLTLAALPLPAVPQAQVVLVGPRRATSASRSNPELLREFIPGRRLHVLPWIACPQDAVNALEGSAFRPVVRLARALGLVRP
jgi:dethiobiotin synthetase